MGHTWSCDQDFGSAFDLNHSIYLNSTILTTLKHLKIRNILVIN